MFKQKIFYKFWIVFFIIINLTDVIWNYFEPDHGYTPVRHLVTGFLVATINYKLMMTQKEEKSL